MVISFPSPVAFTLGSFPVYWYGIAYAAGIFVAYHCSCYLKKFFPDTLSDAQLERWSFVYVLLGIVLGGRLGHVLFYEWDYFSKYPLDVIKTWKGGMSFHGGFLGVVIAALLFSFNHKNRLSLLADITASAVPWALGLVRVANFINQELYGRPAPDLAWAVIFPLKGDGIPRHPSQLYEAMLEGVVLGALMWYLTKYRQWGKRPWALTGAFFVGYGLFRWICEWFKEPEKWVNLAGATITIGQYLSLPLIVIGGVILTYSHIFRKTKPLKNI